MALLVQKAYRFVKKRKSRRDDLFEIANNWSWNRGKHTLRFGGRYLHYDLLFFLLSPAEPDKAVPTAIRSSPSDKQRHMPVQWRSHHQIDPAAIFMAFLISVLRSDRALHALLGLGRLPHEDTVRNLF